MIKILWKESCGIAAYRSNHSVLIQMWLSRIACAVCPASWAQSQLNRTVWADDTDGMLDGHKRESACNWRVC